MNDSAEILLIGVDGGGTGCRVAIGTARDGVIVERAGARANAATDTQLAIQNIIATTQTAAVEAGFQAETLSTAVAHVGLAGIMTQADADAMIKALPFGQCVVTDDRPTALTGALGDADGFLVSVGTGTIIAAAKAQQFRYVGGWGFYVADQASGAWLGRAALDRVLQCFDGVMAHSDLTQNLLSDFDSDPNKITAFSLTAMPGDYAKFAPDVVTAAKAGDPIGMALIGEGVDYIRRGLKALDFRVGDALCLSGGVGPHYAPFLPEQMRANITSPKQSAVRGAFQMALNAARKLGRVQS